MIPCTCPACEVTSAFDAETEADELDLIEAGKLAYIVDGDYREWNAANIKGCLLTMETHAV